MSSTVSGEVTLVETMVVFGKVIELEWRNDLKSVGLTHSGLKELSGGNIF